MKLIFAAFAILFCGTSAYPSVFDGPQCKAPNGEGLTTTIQEVLSMVPIKKVVEIYLVAVSSDAEVEAAMKFIQSDKFINIVTKVHKHANIHKLLKFACDELFVDAHYYLSILHEYLGWPAIERPNLLSNNFARSGILGLLQDILEVIPTDEIIALMKKKIETDEYVKKGVELMRSAEFVAIVKDVTNMEEYKYMEDQLRQKGIPVEKIIEFLEKFFGW